MAKQKLFYFQAYDQRQQWQKGSLVAQSKQAAQFLLIAKGFSHIRLQQDWQLNQKPKNAEISVLLNQLARKVFKFSRNSTYSSGRDDRKTGGGMHQNCRTSNAIINASTQIAKNYALSCHGIRYFAFTYVDFITLRCTTIC